MRKLLLLLILVLPLAVLGKDKHKPMKIPVSRWREVKRMQPDSTVLSFTDTLFISFLRKDSFSYHVPNGFIYRGGYTIDEDSLLDFGTARYKIAVKRPNMLVLRNENGIFEMAPDLSDTVRVIVLDTAEKPTPVTGIDQMIGHWTVYKRTTKEDQSGALDPAQTITAAYITGPSTDGKLGYIYSGTDGRNNPSWTIKTFGIDQVLECEGKNNRILKVVKCQKGEMILEEKDVKYYFKQFK